MKINQAEELVGITKKNIRFYEDQGLLMPKRNPENGYREYNLDDVNRLYKIKLLRKLGVSIEDIRLLFTEELLLGECMERHLAVLEKQKQDIDLMKQMCVELSKLSVPLKQMDANVYLEEMEKLEEKGTKFVNIEKRDINKKKIGPLIAAVVIILLLVSAIIVLVWAAFIDPIPWWIMALLIVPMLIPIVGVLIALFQRLKEIDGGEEDEASKY